MPAPQLPSNLRARAALAVAATMRGSNLDEALAPQAAGLLAASLGLSRIHKDDLAQLDAGLSLYDAFYRWARDAVDETHNWPNPGTGTRPP